MTRPHLARVRAYAKINLDLRVLGRRADGYHEIRTIFQTITLHDTLSFSHARGALRLTTSDPAVPADRTNIVWRAAALVWQASGRKGEPHGLSIRIVKRIPTQAGLGGGSSDAAAALITLNRIWNAKLSASDLAALAATLGSDVPFFLLGGTALGLGRGELIYPLPDLPPRPIVVAAPGRGVSTADAYRWLAGSDRVTGRPQRLPVPWPPHELAVGNDFEPVVFSRVPAAARLRRLFGRAGAEPALLSGSGSAVVGVFASERDARRAAALAAPVATRVWISRLKPRARSVRR